jgi:prepilin-type N-terminal cleavage/methylation domain-containing protein
MNRRNTASGVTTILSRGGFTLIETMVVLVAFGLIMGVAFGVFSTLSSTTIENSQVARSQAGARVAIEEIER